MDGAPSPKTAEKIEYIRLLEHRNRLKKAAATDKTRRLQEMEQGFELHWAGANEARSKQRVGARVRHRPRDDGVPSCSRRRTWASARAQRRQIDGRAERRDENEPAEVDEEDEYADDFDPSDEVDTDAESPQWQLGATRVVRALPRVAAAQKGDLGMDAILEVGKTWNNSCAAAANAPMAIAGLSEREPAALQGAATLAEETDQKAPTGEVEVEASDDVLLRQLSTKVKTLHRSQKKLLVHIAAQFNEENNDGANDTDVTFGPSDVAAMRQCLDILKRLSKGGLLSSELLWQEKIRRTAVVDQGRALGVNDDQVAPLCPSRLTLRIHDGWDGPRVAGLDAIAVLSPNGEHMPIKPSDLRLFAGNPPRPAPPTSRSASELPRLLAPPNSDDDLASKSWIVRLPSDGPVELHVQLSTDILPEGTRCRIWNCSASPGKTDGISSTPGSLGVRRLEMFLNDRQVWRGELARFQTPCNRDLPVYRRKDVLDVPLRHVVAEIPCAAPAVPPSTKHGFPIPIAREDPLVEQMFSEARIKTSEDAATIKQLRQTPPEKDQNMQATTHPTPAAAPPLPVAARSVVECQTATALQYAEGSVGIPLWLADRSFNLRPQQRPRVVDSKQDDKGSSSAASVVAAPRDDVVARMVMKGSFVEEDVADEGRVDVLPGRNTDRGGDKQRDPRARRRRVLTIEDSVEPLNDTDELPEASAPRREAEIPADKGEKEWTEVKALSAELDVLSPLSQLAKQSSATKPAAPSFDHKTRNKASIGRVASDESLQQSWDSLTYFSKKNRSRLSQAGAAVVGGNFTVTSASHDPPKPIVEAMIRDEAATSVMASGSQQAVQQAGGPDVKQQQQQQQQHPPSENIFETTSTTLLTASQFENFANSIEDTAHTSFSLDEPPRTGPGLLTRDQQQQQQLDEPKEDREFEREETMVEIPTLPRGRVLKLELLSTWGDPYYVGLHGIEVFDENGEQLKVVTIAATPPSINVLPEYDSDPRTADKLIDGISFTCDELHAWLAPFEDEQEHSITLELAAEIAKPAPAISMLRIWNYNKSRAHSYRGVRRMRASLDDTPVFEGEIRKALGSLEGAASACEMILFTASEDILRNIEKNDVALRPDEDANLLREAQQLLRARPKTADKLQRVALDDLPVSYGDMLAEEGLVRDVARPRTSVPTSVCEEEEEEEEGKEQYPRARVVVAFSSKKSNAEHLAAAAAAAASPDQLGESASNGGGGGAAAGTSSIIAQARGTTTTNRHYVGLSGIQVYADASGAAISILPSQLSAEPRDLETMGFSGDPRTLSKLVDGATETVDDRHFWLVPFDAKSPPWLALDLGAPTTVWGIGVSNYNKSPEDAARGARVIQVEADGELRGLVELRPAPGRGWVDFHQRIALDDIEMPRPPIKQFGVRHVSAVQKPRADHILEDYETPELPRGAMVRLVFHGTWGDAYYLGLDGLELRDAEQRVVSPERVCGLPDSIRVLGDDFRRDLRVPANLFSSSSSRVWLAPNRISLSDAEFPGLPDENELYVFLNKPVSLAALTIWNYSKTPNRGARELSVYLDNNLVARVRLARGDAAPDGQHVLFTTDRFNRRGSNRAAAVAEGGQDVLCIDENQVRIRSRTMFDTDVCAEGVFSAQMHHNHRPTTGIASTTGDLVGSRRR